MTINHRLVVALYKQRMKKLCNQYSMTKFKDLIEIQKLILNERSNIKSLRLIDEEVFKLNDCEVKDLRAGLRESNAALFNRAYKSFIKNVFESIYVHYIENKEYDKLYDQCARRSMLPELIATINKFDHTALFKDIY